MLSQISLLALSQWIAQYFNFHTLAIVLAAFGLITFVLATSYYLSFETVKTKSWAVKILSDFFIALILILGLYVLKNILFLIPDAGIADIYRSNTVLALLLTILLSAKQRSVTWVNCLAPPLLLIIEIYPQQSLLVSVVLTLINILFSVFIYFISNHKQTIIRRYPYYFGVQIIFGIVWWFDIWIIHPFQPLNVLWLVAELVIYMMILRCYQISIIKLAHHYDYMVSEVNVDPLTQVRNRLSFNRMVNNLFKHPSLSSPPIHDRVVSMAMLDIDHFKEFNDTYGHSAGDAVLKHVASIFKNELLNYDNSCQIFRFGGEEFIILFMGSDSNEAASILKQIQRAVIANPLTIDKKSLSVTISVGVSQFKLDDQNFEDFFERVDRYMYKAKNTGNSYITIENRVFKVDL